MKRQNVEIFSAGCAACEETISLLKRLACGSCDVRVLDMHDKKVSARAKKYGIKSVPAVVINGKLAGCCEGRGPDETVLRAAGIGARQ